MSKDNDKVVDLDRTKKIKELNALSDKHGTKKPSSYKSWPTSLIGKGIDSLKDK